MAEIVNMRRARKAKARVEKDKTATENRIRFGQTKADRERDAAEKLLAQRQFDGHKRVDEDD
jgi:hypothetical protein